MQAFARQLRSIDYLNSGRFRSVSNHQRRPQTQVSGEGSPCDVTEEPLDRKLQKDLAVTSYNSWCTTASHATEGHFSLLASDKSMSLGANFDGSLR